MKTMRHLSLVAVAALALLAVACHGGGTTTYKPPGGDTGETVQGSGSEFPSSGKTPTANPDNASGLTEAEAEAVQRQLQDVYFDFDRSELRPDARAALTNNATVLRAQRPGSAVDAGATAQHLPATG